MATIGDLRFGLNGTTKQRAIHDIADVQYPAVRVGVNGSIGAIHAVDPANATDSSLRVGTPNGVKALVDSVATAFETFDDGVWPDDWNGETSSYNLDATTNTPFTHDNGVSGGYSLKCDSAYGNVYNTNYGTQRGNEYVTRTALTVSDADPGLLIADQVTSSSDSFDNCYWAQISPEAGTLRIFYRSNGSHTLLADTPMSISTNTEYILGARYYSDGVQAVVYDGTDGSQITETPKATGSAATKYSGGTIAFYTGESTVFYDNIFETAIGNGGATYDYSTVS